MRFFFDISACNCGLGTIENEVCDKTNGQCPCKSDDKDDSRVKGRKCDTCKMEFWNLTKENSLGCEDCQCSREGSKNASKSNVQFFFRS